MSDYKLVSGGVCAPQGFVANGVRCGIRKNPIKKDLALIFSEKRASCAAVYTKNLVKGAPLEVTRRNIEDGYAQAVVCNSGNANTCNSDGIEIASRMCSLVSDKLGIAERDVVVASTGVIGQKLDINIIASGISPLAEGLCKEGNNSAAEAIMTTDTVKKEIALQFELGGKTCTVGAMAKGSGMICPNMATMLVFITTDAAVSPAALKKALLVNVEDTFNMLSVDGDTSTNDMVSILANGMAGNAEINEESADFSVFCDALHEIMASMCRLIARDGEGATKLLECFVYGAADKNTAKIVAKSVISSSLVKAAMFGSDANWGRILCAAGYSGADIDVHKVDVAFDNDKGHVDVCKDGAGLDFSEEKAKTILLEDNVKILVNLNSGEGSAVARGCDLTYDYVKINGDYRT